MGAVAVTLAAPVAWRDVVALGKPRLSALVLCTTGVGLWLAPGPLPWPRALLVLAATALVVGAANALNCYLERHTDALMRRTRGRPLPAGRLEPRLALGLSLGGAVVALAVLYRAANPLTALLAFVAYAIYGWVYTPMKRHSLWALPVGAVPGAIPPLLGWTAVTGSLDAPGVALFAILFCWQLPHFLAIAVYLKDDYARGGLEVLSHRLGSRAVVGLCVAATAALVLASMGPWHLRLAGTVYAGGAAGLGAAMLAWAGSGLLAAHIGRWARGLFIASVAYLTALMGLLVAGA